MNLSWVTDDLAIGGSFPAGAAASLGVGAIIDVRSEACDDREELAACGIRFLHLPTDDHQAVAQTMLDASAAFASEAQAAELKTLIHCEHGIGRSATVALCVLVDRGWSPMAALARAKDARALVSPSPAQYEAWVSWMARRTPHVRAPDFQAFKAIAYRHLVQRA
jgi:protein-tyrosine phosphatase